jgi:hypothetical protein
MSIYVLISSSNILIALLKSKLNEVSACLQLIINVFFYLSVGEKLQYFLLVLFDFVDNWNQEEQREEYRA